MLWFEVQQSTAERRRLITSTRLRFQGRADLGIIVSRCINGKTKQKNKKHALFEKSFYGQPHNWKGGRKLLP